MKKILKTFIGLTLFMIIIILGSVAVVLKGVFSVLCALGDAMQEGCKKITDPFVYNKLDEYFN